MRIDWAIPCRYAEVNDNLATIVGGGIDHYWPPAFPAQLQIVLAVRLALSEDDLGPGKTHTLIIRVHDPEMTLISEVPATFGDIESPGRRPGWELGMAMTIVQQFDVPSPGIYTLELAIAGRSHTVPIAVSERQES